MVLKIKILLLHFLAFALSAHGQTGYNYLEKGLKFKDIHELGEFKKIQTKAINLHYALLLVKDANQSYYFCLTKYQDHEYQKGDYQLKIVQTLPLYDFNEHLFTMKMEGCYVNGIKDATIVAMGIKTGDNSIKEWVEAWRVDKKNGLIQKISAKGISCGE
jgi:hypothetical protein